MNRWTCGQLDDFFAGTLPEFAEHVASCDACGRAASDMNHLTAILKQATDGAIPERLVGCVRRRIVHARRIRLVVTAGLIATAAAAAWLAVSLTSNAQRVTLVIQPLATMSPPEPARVTFPRGNVIAMPVETGSPNVTFVLVYPAPPGPDERNR